MMASKAPLVKFTPWPKNGQTLGNAANEFCPYNEGTILFNYGLQFLESARDDEMQKPY